MDLTDEARAAIAKAMGMKRSEIIDAWEVEDGLAVTTHDGVNSLIDEYGTVSPYVPPAAGRGGQADAAAASSDPDSGQDSGPGDDPGGGQPGPPQGSAEQVLEWVGDDKTRAAAALQAERAKDAPRKGLVAKLEPLAG